MSALINISQLLGAGIGTPGVARNDIWLDTEVLLEDAVGGNSSWTWTLLSKPLGSATVINSQGTSSTTLTPDQPGTYRVKLATNGGGPGNEHILVFRVRKTNTGADLDRGWALPAVGERPGESNYLVDGLPNTRNWSEPFETIFADILANFGGGGGGTVTDVTGVAPLSSTGGATPALSISPASGSSAGSMSSAHFTLVDGATDAATPSALVKRDGSGRLQAVAGVAPSDVAVVSQLGGGAPSRVVALDVHDIIEWKLDEAVSPWANTGNGGILNLEAVGTKAQIIQGGSIHGDRCVRVDWNTDSYFRSPETTIGQVDAGTIHGWVRLADTIGTSGRTIISKDAAGHSPAQLSIHIADDGPYGAGIRVDVAGTATAFTDSNSVEGWVPRLHWAHLALTWDSDVVRFYINGRQHQTTGTFGAFSWTGGRWNIGYGRAYAGNGDYSSWRVCDVARSAAYIDEVYRRAVGRWP